MERLRSFLERTLMAVYVAARLHYSPRYRHINLHGNNHCASDKICDAIGQLLR